MIVFILLFLIFHLRKWRIFANSLSGLFFWPFFFCGGGGRGGTSSLSLCASDIFSLLAHCLVSKKVSVEHCRLQQT